MAKSSSKNIQELIGYLKSYKTANKNADKAKIETVAKNKFNLIKQRSVFIGNEFAIRFSQAKGRSFSNVVLSLSSLKRYDKKPFLVCVVRPDDIKFLIANTTFLKKISHSSHTFRTDNIKGSFLGHDIIMDYLGTKNIESNFEKLFQIHASKSWSDNLLRLVDATKKIEATGKKYFPSQKEIELIIASPLRAISLSKSQAYKDLEEELTNTISNEANDILVASDITNVNLRGNTIEQIITKGSNLHGLDDKIYKLRNDISLHVDIKTKILNLSSNPKGYNIDKILKILSNKNSVVAFLFVAINKNKRTVTTKLLSIFDKSILTGTRIQHHWAGRNSRGVTQLSCDWKFLTDDNHAEDINLNDSIKFLQKLIDI